MCEVCPRFPLRAICDPTPPPPPCRIPPEDLPPAGMPSRRPRCCQDPRLLLTCNPRYFEPSYCLEQDNMTKLVAHEYKYRWIHDRRSWARKCCRDLSMRQTCERAVSCRCRGSCQRQTSGCGGC